MRELIIDDSLSLINRTGAYYLARDLVSNFARFGRVRRWRIFGEPLPSTFVRKVLGRLMLREFDLCGQRPPLWPDSGREHIKLFLDPLYVLRSRLSSRDIVLCHDIGPITYAGAYHPVVGQSYRNAYDKICRTQPGMVFVSQASRAAFAEQFGTSFRFMEAIPLYLRNDLINGEQEAVPGIAPPFLLSVGALEKRKNHLASIEGYRRSGLEARGIRFIICGSRGDQAAEIMQAAESAPGVRVLGYASDAQLRWLYHNAAAFILPSLLEGFGMPALEAASYGLQPIVSKDSALTEAVGGLGVSIDPFNCDAIAAAMRQAVDCDPNLREQRSADLADFAKQASRQRFLTRWSALIEGELA